MNCERGIDILNEILKELNENLRCPAKTKKKPSLRVVSFDETLVEEIYIEAYSDETDSSPKSRKKDRKLPTKEDDEDLQALFEDYYSNSDEDDDEAIAMVEQGLNTTFSEGKKVRIHTKLNARSSSYDCDWEEQLQADELKDEPVNESSLAQWTSISLNSRDFQCYEDSSEDIDAIINRNFDADTQYNIDSNNDLNLDSNFRIGLKRADALINHIRTGCGKYFQVDDEDSIKECRHINLDQ